MKPNYCLSSEIILTDEQLKAIGCLAVESASVEHLLNAIIKKLCKFTDIQTDLFIGKWTIGTKADAINTLIQPRLKSKKIRLRFESFYKNLKDSITKRNLIVHGEWSVSAPYNAFLILLSASPRRSDAMAYSKKKKLNIKAKDIMNVVYQMSQCHSELLQIYIAVHSRKHRTSATRQRTARDHH